MLIFNVIKQSAIDLWDEMLYLIIFNIICLIGILLIIPGPFVTFGLYGLAYDVGQGRGIKFSTFFVHARRLWKQAYLWGGINLVVLLMLGLNLNFYSGIEAEWARIAQVVVFSVTFFWIMLQLVMLPLYPRLIEPGFKLALRNAAVVIGRYPLMVFALAVMVALVWGLTLIFPPVVFLGALAITAVVCNRVVGALVDKELEREAENETRSR